MQLTPEALKSASRGFRVPCSDSSSLNRHSNWSLKLTELRWKAEKKNIYIYICIHIYLYVIGVREVVEFRCSRQRAAPTSNSQVQCQLLFHFHFGVGEITCRKSYKVLKHPNIRTSKPKKPKPLNNISLALF